MLVEPVMATNLLVEPVLCFELHKNCSGVSALRNLHAEMSRIKLTRELLHLLFGQADVEICAS